MTFANGGDNFGVYVPVFASAGTGDMVIYVAVFLVLVGVWVAAGRFFATRPAIAQLFSRWAHVLLPVVLIGIGVLILIEGGAFGTPLHPAVRLMRRGGPDKVRRPGPPLCTTHNGRRGSRPM